MKLNYVVLVFFDYNLIMDKVNNDGHSPFNSDISGIKYNPELSPFYTGVEKTKEPASKTAPIMVSPFAQSEDELPDQTDEIKTQSGLILSVEKPVYKSFIFDDKEDSEYSMYAFEEKQKEYVAKIKPILLEILSKDWTYPLMVEKSDLVIENPIQQISNANDQIEFNLENDRNGKIKLMIRNRSLVGEERRIKPNGETVELTAGEVQNFCDKNEDDKRINITHIREVLPKNGETEKRKKFFGFVNRMGEISGVACVLENNDRSVYLLRLATAPRSQGEGIGGEIIESLKNRYEEITLTPTPEGDIRGRTGDPTEDLRRYYQKRGFIPGAQYVWNKNWLNLNDATAAGTWRNVDTEKNTIVFDKHKIRGDNVLDFFLKRVLEDRMGEISDDEVAESLLLWSKTMDEIKTTETKLRQERDEKLKKMGL
jgi:hypothetical protein